MVIKLVLILILQNSKRFLWETVLFFIWFLTVSKQFNWNTNPIHVYRFLYIDISRICLNDQWLTMALMGGWIHLGCKQNSNWRRIWSMGFHYWNYVSVYFLFWFICLSRFFISKHFLKDPTTRSESHTLMHGKLIS